jgi:hypothetical protein
MPGSTRKFTIDGISYPVAADSNATMLLSREKKEVIATSGKGVVKTTFQIPQVELDLVVTPSEEEQIRAAVLGSTTVKFSMTDFEGNVYRSSGSVDVGNYERAENKLKVTALAVEEWTLFPI